MARTPAASWAFAPSAEDRSVSEILDYYEAVYTAEPWFPGGRDAAEGALNQAEKIKTNEETRSRREQIDGRVQ